MEYAVGLKGGYGEGWKGRGGYGVGWKGRDGYGVGGKGRGGDMELDGRVDME